MARSRAIREWGRLIAVVTRNVLSDGHVRSSLRAEKECNRIGSDRAPQREREREKRLASRGCTRALALTRRRREKRSNRAAAVCRGDAEQRQGRARRTRHIELRSSSSLRRESILARARTHTHTHTERRLSRGEKKKLEDACSRQLQNEKKIIPPKSSSRSFLLFSPLMFRHVARAAVYGLYDSWLVLRVVHFVRALVAK